MVLCGLDWRKPEGNHPGGKWKYSKKKPLEILWEREMIILDYIRDGCVRSRVSKTNALTGESWQHLFYYWDHSCHPISIQIPVAFSEISLFVQIEPIWLEVVPKCSKLQSRYNGSFELLFAAADTGKLYTVYM